MNAWLITCLTVMALALAAPHSTLAQAQPSAPVTSSPAPIKGPSIKLYDQKMVLALDGSGEVTGRIQLTGVTPGRVDLPAADWGDVINFKIADGPPELQVQANMKGTNARLALVLPPGTPESVDLQFTFSLQTSKTSSETTGAVKPRYSMISHRFVNSTNLAVERYRLEVWLPEGSVVHSVLEALPRAKASETTPRVQLVGDGRRQGAILSIAGLRFPDTTSMRLEAETESKSWLLLLFGLALAALYMVFFRDIVFRAKSDGEVREHHSHRTHE